jgi:hypothetical protein
MMRARSRFAATMGASAAAVGALATAATAQSNNPGRDFNLQQYERRYDPGAYGSPSYHPQNPGQQYNQLQYERRYRAPPAVERPRVIERRPTGESAPRVRSLKPTRKTDEQVRRAQRKPDAEEN